MSNLRDAIHYYPTTELPKAWDDLSADQKIAVLQAQLKTAYQELERRDEHDESASLSYERAQNDIRQLERLVQASSSEREVALAQELSSLRESWGARLTSLETENIGLKMRLSLSTDRESEMQVMFEHLQSMLPLTVKPPPQCSHDIPESACFRCFVNRVRKECGLKPGSRMRLAHQTSSESFSDAMISAIEAHGGLSDEHRAAIVALRQLDLPLKLKQEMLAPLLATIERLQTVVIRPKLSESAQEPPPT